MRDADPKEMWQVEVNGQVYEANFAELTDWIAEGALQPDDKVRRGQLRWIEARKVPTLAAFFNVKSNGLPPSVVVAAMDAQQSSVEPPAETVSYATDPITANAATATLTTSSETIDPASYQTAPQFTSLSAGSCASHVDRQAAFVCLSCNGAFCRDCVKSFGSSVIICACCGGMCKPKTELEALKKAAEFRSASITGGFGFGDFGAAIAYPFKFPASLILGGIMFMFFSLGQTASGMGGIYMIAASIFSFMLANMLEFGILANTVESFAHGKVGSNFMPSFDDFSIWDDVLHPFFLYIGAYISSFGPLILLGVVAWYLVVNSVTSQMNTFSHELERTPGTPYYSTRDTLDQSEQVREVLANSNRINQSRLDVEEDIENGGQPGAIDNEEEDFQHVNNMIAESRRRELESVVGKTPETQEKEMQEFFTGILKIAAPLVVVGFIALLWGLFFFPAACTVAGYTRSFVATVNPLVGLDTIKRLGFDYMKILFMGFVLLVASGVVGMVLAKVFLPFNMPGVGNIPAKVVGSLFGFYLWIVFSCILGFAIFKASDRLKLDPN
jgi:hypothetical protein